MSELGLKAWRNSSARFSINVRRAAGLRRSATTELSALKKKVDPRAQGHQFDWATSFLSSSSSTACLRRASIRRKLSSVRPVSAATARNTLSSSLK